MRAIPCFPLKEYLLGPCWKKPCNMTSFTYYISNLLFCVPFFENPLWPKRSHISSPGVWHGMEIEPFCGHCLFLVLPNKGQC